MKALVLVGGYGTRLRPLTINQPKSVFPFVNKPISEYQIEALSKVGVKEVVLAVNYQADHIRNDLAHLESKYDIKITFSKEPQALGTAGPLRLAESILKKDNPTGVVFVMNSDIICDYPLKDLLEKHIKTKAQATIVLAQVKQPSRYGVVVCKQDGQVQKFVQKPEVFISNMINAGIYVLNVSVIDSIPNRFCMIEKEVFPQLAEKGKLQSLKLNNDFWFDIGKPTDYLQGQNAYLKYWKPQSKVQCQISGDIYVHQSAVVGKNCLLGPNVVIGPGCMIEDGVRLKECTLVANNKIGTGSYISNAILSWKTHVQPWSRIQGFTVIAQEVVVKKQSRITNCMILSHKSVTGVNQNQTIL